MNTFLNLFSGLATLVTGSVAIIIYFFQKRDTKIQAARVLLTEIRIAEERIDQIRDILEGNSSVDLPSIFPTKNWKNYSHLFISNFDQDELKLINSFYDYGEIIEEFAKRNNNYFWISTEERAKIVARELAKNINKSFGKTDPDKLVLNKRDYLNTGLDAHNRIYFPKKTLEGISDYLLKIPKITTSSCGSKLKKIARLN
jgi:hypothetical protein